MAYKLFFWLFINIQVNVNTLPKLFICGQTIYEWWCKNRDTPNKMKIVPFSFKVNSPECNRLFVSIWTLHKTVIRGVPRNCIAFYGCVLGVLISEVLLLWGCCCFREWENLAGARSGEYSWWLICTKLWVTSRPCHCLDRITSSLWNERNTDIPHWQMFMGNLMNSLIHVCHQFCGYLTVFDHHF